MNKEIIKAQADVIAQVFEAQTSHKMKHSTALEILSALYGKKNYNLLADYIKPASALSELGGIEREHAENNADIDYGDECVVVTVNGRKIKTPAYPLECEYVRITDRADNEIGYWDETEWRDDPACVMGAIVGALNGDEQRLLPQFATQKDNKPSKENFDIIHEPLTFSQIKAIMEQGGNFEGVVPMSLDRLMEGLEAVNDLAEELVTGHEYYEMDDIDVCVHLQGISYTPVGNLGDKVLVKINAQMVYH